MKNIFLLICLVLFGKFSYSQVSYTWNGSTSTAWNTTTNWTPNGLPGAIDNVIIVTGANNCLLPSNKTITNLTITSGLLNLGGFTLNTTGVVACNSGTCSNGTFNSTATTLTFAGTLFSANIIATVPDVYFNGSTFNGNVNVTKTSASNIGSSGNNVFNGVTSITNAGAGYLLLTNGALGRNETFNAATTLNTTNTGGLYIGYSRDVNINANISVNNTAGTGLIQIGRSGSTGTVNLNTGITITCGTFVGASLNLCNILQTGSTAQNWSPGANGGVNIFGSVINGSLTVNAGIISAQTSTFATAVTYSASGSILNTWSSGGNLYNGILRVNNSSSGYFGFANGTADIYNADVYAINTSSTGGRIIFGNNSTSQFNGNIYVSQSGSGTGSGIALGWGGTFPVINLASGKNIFVSGAFSSGYLQILKMQAAVTTTINLTTTGTSNVQLRDNIFAGTVNITAPDIYAYGGTYNAATSFIKTGGGGNHNSGNTNIFNSTLNIENQSTGYFMLSYQSPDQFNGDITVTSSNTGGIYFGWYGDSGTPTLAAGKTVFIGAGGYTAGDLHFGAFTQIAPAIPFNITLTGTALFRVLSNTIPCTFNSVVNVTAPNVEVRGGTFNQDVTFTKTAGTSNHNNGNQNIFNGKCTINQQSTTGYFMLGYNSNDLFNGDIEVTNTGTQEIYFGWSSGTGTPTQAAGFGITIGAAGFSGGGLVFNTFTQLGTSPINLNFTGSTTYLRFARSSIFNGNITSVTPRVFFDGCTFNGTVNSTKTGANSDASSGGNIFNGLSTFDNNGAGYLLFGNGTPDVWNANVNFTNSGSNYIYPCYNSAGNLFNGSILLNSGVSALGINFCAISTVATATMSAGNSISTGTYDGGYLYLQRFTQLGTSPVNLTLNATATNLNYGPSSYLGGNVVSSSPSLYLNGCIFNGTSDLTKNGPVGNYGQGGNVFNGISNITNTGSNYLLLGNSNPDIWNDDVTFTNTGSERLLPCWATVGNMFNGNIYVNTGGSAQGITFCGGNTTATATLAATKSVYTGTLSLNSGYLILKQFTQLGSAPINLIMASTATYIQYGPSSNLGGNVTSVSPGLYFHGCIFNGTVDCTKNGTTYDVSNGNNVFNGATTITHSGAGPGYLMFGNGNSDQFNSSSTFNNIGSGHIYVANNSVGNVFGGVTTFNNSPIGNNLIYVSPNSTGTLFNDNIITTSTNGQGVQFCTGATASATLVAGKTISVGAAGFSAGTLLLKQFTQVGPTPQSFTLTGSGNLTFGPISYFGGNVTSSSPTLFYNGVNFNGLLTSVKTGSTNDASPGGNIFNGLTNLTNIGDGYLLLGNGNFDLFNSATTFNNNGGGNSSRIYFAHNHSGLTTRFASDVTMNSNKTGGADTWSYFVCEGANTNLIIDGNLIINNLGAIRSDMRILQGNASTATYNSNVTVNLNNSHTSTQIQMGVQGTSFYNGNITVANTLGGTGSGIYFNNSTAGTSTLAASKTISLGTGGFVDGTLSLLRFTQISATPQTLLQTTGTARIYLGPITSFDGNVNFNFPQVYLNSATYNGTATIEKNGATDNYGTGGNIFNGTTIITNSGSGYLLTGGTNADLFNGLTTFNNTGSHSIYFAHNHTGQTTIFNQNTILNSNKSGGTITWSYLISEGTNSNVQFNADLTINNNGAIRSDLRTLSGGSTTALFGGNLTLNLANSHTSTQIIFGQNGTSTYNGNISVSNSGGANGVYFNNSTSATSSMAAGKSISSSIGSFPSGILSLPRYTQLGSAANALPLGVTSDLRFGPTSLFGGGINSTSGAVTFNTSIFNSNVNSTKNGTTNDASVGGNTFNGTSTLLTNNGTGYFLMANTLSDAYNSNVTFSQNNTGIFYPNHNTNCTYSGDITVNSTSTYTITFGQSGGGIATLNGGNAQTINKTGTVGNPNFTRLITNKTANDVTLNTRINVTNYLTLTQGIINTTATNILNMNNASTTTVGNALSYINGPMNYDMAVSGTRTLNLPIGKVPDWRPVILALVHNNSTSYTYNSEVFNSSANALGWTLPSTIANVSRIHYWDITRRNTSTAVETPTLHLNGAQTITLFYDVNDGVTDPVNLTICKNTYTATTAWKDIGGAGATLTSGNVTSTSAPTIFNSFSRFTLGNKDKGTNPLPVELLYFTATPINNLVNLEWATASELNNDYFEIEKSIDGVNFQFVATVKAYGTGNSASFQTYKAVDANPYKGLSYYRLKQVDKTSEFKYAPLVDVEFKTNSFVNIFPNPVSNTLYLNYSNDYDNATIKIINSIGAIVKENESLKSFNGQINVTNLANGIYYFVIETANKTENIKISIQK